MNKAKTRNKLLILQWLILILFMLLTAATYTWFSLSKTPSVSDMAIYVNSNTGLELSWRAIDGDWSQHLDFSEAGVADGVLKPVTYSYGEDMFYAASFGIDGRISGITYRLTDELNANSNGADGYYLKTTFYARTGEAVKVSLMPAAMNSDNKETTGTYLIGTPLWNSEDIIHDNGGHGAEFAVRLGLRITKTTLTGKPLEDEPSVMYIYEPNCNMHIDGTDAYTETLGIGGGALIPEELLIRQTASSWSEVSPVERTAVLYDLGEFLDDAYLFELSPDVLACIELYIWLEGQDTDCVNEIGQEAQILASIQFDSQAGNNSGLVPIE